MSIERKLKNLFPDRLIELDNLEDMPRNIYLSYILIYDDKPIVVGHGKYNRAKIIFDSEDKITSGHIKAIFVRLYHLYGDSSSFNRFIIKCTSKKEAMKTEKIIHNAIGGNNRDLPSNILNLLFEGLRKQDQAYLVLKMALCSSFDGISDIRRWKREHILTDDVWNIVNKKLKLKSTK